MFGISFTEIALVAIIALLVVGPQKLPTMMRSIGQWIGRLRRLTTQVRAQTGIDEILREEGIDGVHELRSLLRGEIAGARGTKRHDAYEEAVEVDAGQEYPPEGPDAAGALADDLVGSDEGRTAPALADEDPEEPPAPSAPASSPSRPEAEPPSPSTPSAAPPPPSRPAANPPAPSTPSAAPPPPSPPVAKPPAPSAPTAAASSPLARTSRPPRPGPSPKPPPPAALPRPKLPPPPVASGQSAARGPTVSRNPTNPSTPSSRRSASQADDDGSRSGNE